MKMTIDISTRDGMLNGVAYKKTLAGPQGCHVHFWIPKGMTNECIGELKRRAKYLWDVVSFSNERIPAADPEKHVKDVTVEAIARELYIHGHLCAGYSRKDLERMWVSHSKHDKEYAKPYYEKAMIIRGMYRPIIAALRNRIRVLERKVAQYG